MTGSRIQIKLRRSGESTLLSCVWKFSTGEGNLIRLEISMLYQCSVQASTLTSVKMMDKLRKKILAKDNVAGKRNALSDRMGTTGRY